MPEEPEDMFEAEEESFEDENAEAIEDDSEASPSDSAPAGKEKRDRDYNIKEVFLSDEELDVIADASIETINTLLPWFGVQNVTIEEYEGDEGELIFDIVGENLAILIGRHGRTLDAFQFVVSSIVTKKIGFRHPVIVDVEGYKHRCRQKLITIAKSSAARAIRQKREVRLRPMTPYERRIIHITLRDDPRISTGSEGVEPNRLVIITPN
ncbi:MAG: KH domain-containing protein [Coriobacteriales bacterium]|jgi:spoIIIJ-associated protein|nr:KH domain-containing protein [Coriobacteriales bacterium]